MCRMLLLALLFTAWILARTDEVRYLRWSEVQLIASGIGITEAKEWDSWIRFRDGQYRSRMDHPTDDAISVLILFGTSFTTEPRFGKAEDAVDPAGRLTSTARARVEAFIQQLDTSDEQRFRFVFDYLRRQQISAAEVFPYLAGNLRRFALDPVTRSQTPPGVSPPADFDIDEAIRNLKAKGTVPAHIRRVAVVSPSLNFSGPDSSPLQTTQPFAVLDALLRAGLIQATDVQLVVLDTNPFLVAHLRESIAKKHSVLPVPPQWQARTSVLDLNLAAQTTEARFDMIVIPASLLASYDSTDQTLASWNIAQMLNAGGVVLADKK